MRLLEEQWQMKDPDPAMQGEGGGGGGGEGGREERAKRPQAWQLRPRGEHFYDWGIPHFDGSVLQKVLGTRAGLDNKEGKRTWRPATARFLKRCKLIRMENIGDTALWKSIKG